MGYDVHRRALDQCECKSPNCTFSPIGDMLAVMDRRGYAHIVDWKASSSESQVFGSVKMNSSARSIWWNDQGVAPSLGENSGACILDVV